MPLRSRRHAGNSVCCVGIGGGWRLRLATPRCCWRSSLSMQTYSLRAAFLGTGRFGVPCAQEGVPTAHIMLRDTATSVQSARFGARRRCLRTNEQATVKRPSAVGNPQRRFDWGGVGATYHAATACLCGAAILRSIAGGGTVYASMSGEPLGGWVLRGGRGAGDLWIWR